MTTDLRSQAARVAAMRATADSDVRRLAADLLLERATFFGTRNDAMVELLLTKNGVRIDTLRADFARLLDE